MSSALRRGRFGLSCLVEFKTKIKKDDILPMNAKLMMNWNMRKFLAATFDPHLTYIWGHSQVALVCLDLVLLIYVQNGESNMALISWRHHYLKVLNLRKLFTFVVFSKKYAGCWIKLHFAFMKTSFWGSSHKQFRIWSDSLWNNWLIGAWCLDTVHL